MPMFLNTRGRTTLGIGICGRCSRKFSLDELIPDPNYPGLKVCRKDADDYDPYRLGMPAADRLVLPFVRPDTPLYSNPAGFIDEQSEEFVITEDTDEYIIFFPEHDDRKAQE
jgi:hypothetical protein